MNIHKNVRLTPLRREEMALAVMEGRLSQAQTDGSAIRRPRSGRHRRSVATIGAAIAAFLVEMIVKPGVQNALRKRLLQIVEQPVPGKDLARVAYGKSWSNSSFSMAM